jgi:hypothetical protein
MGLSSEELDRLADEMYKQRRITSSVYCGNCGYNLRTLPYNYHCPECGNAYNARPLSMRGIFLPYQYEPPVGDGFYGLICGLGALLLAFRAITKTDPWLMGIAAVFVALTFVFAVKFTRGLLGYIKACSIARRIRLEEEE